MRRLWSGFRHIAEAIAAAMMAAMFLTFILQIFVRYTARLGWVSDTFPFLEPTYYGWTLEFCLLLWVWLVFWGNSFVVRQRDHVVFDLLLNHVRPSVQRWFVILTGLAICIGLILSFEPTWAKFHILRLKNTATLKGIFGDGVRMRELYSVYFLFLVAVSVRYAWAAYRAIRHDVEHQDKPNEEPGGQ